MSIGKSAGSHMQIVNVNSMNFILVYISFKVMVMSLLHLDLHGVLGHYIICTGIVTIWVSYSGQLEFSVVLTWTT